MQLPSFAREGRYSLRYLHTHEEVSHGALFAQVFRPYTRLIMPLVVSYEDQHADTCPGCRSHCDTDSSPTLRCACGVVYTRLSRSEDHIRMQPAHRKPFHQLVQAVAPMDPISAQLSPMVDPPARHQSSTDKKPRFKFVKNIKNVDFSAPRMVSVRDLLGFMYTVPWRMVRTTEKVTFFLRRFTAGGSLFDWTRDYIVVDDDANKELTVANWETTAYPGISVALRPRDSCDQATLRQNLVTRIQDMLSRSAQTPRKQDFQDVVDEMCLLMGGTSAQIELRSFVEAAVNVQWLIQSTRHPTPTQPETFPSICLICRKEFSALVDLAKHAQCHLTVLRCEGHCNACDRQRLPFFVDENVSERRKGGHTSSKADPPAVGYREHSGPSYRRRSGPPPDAWVCCLCRQTNLSRTCPDRCPLDGHFLCNACYQYK